MRNILLFVIITIVVSGCNKNDDTTQPLFASLEEEINYLADQYVKLGAVIGIIDKQQNKHIFSFGSKSINNSEQPDANTVFDIGSITKSFTAILAADMYLKGKIPDEVVGHFLPVDKVTMPSRDGVDITFVHILTHMSGLPRTPHMDGSVYPLPEGFDANNPYSVYTTDDIYDFLTNYCTLEFTPGTYWGYSNTSYGLLGHTLGLIDGSSYKNILNRDIFNILTMDNSSLFLTDNQLKNMAPGHDASLKIVPNYTANDIFQGCGMIKSSLADMFKFLEANMGLVESSLKDAMKMTHQRTEDIYTGSMGYIGLSWFIIELDDKQEIIYNGGRTNGHSTYIAFNLSNLTGAIILLNTQSQNNSTLNFGHDLMMALNKY